MNEAYEKLESLREEFGLTVKAFCSLLGIKISTYYTYKSTRNPSGTLKVLIDLLQEDSEGTMKRLRKRIKKT